MVSLDEPSEMKQPEIVYLIFASSSLIHNMGFHSMCMAANGM